CDMSVKFISGWMLIKEVKTSDKIPNIPMLLMGEVPAPAPDDDLKSFGIVKYLQVPFRDADLSFLINSTLQLARTSGTIENKFTKAKESLIQNRCEDAVEQFEELNSLTKRSMRSLVGLSTALVQRGEFEKAETLMVEAAQK